MMMMIRFKRVHDDDDDKELSKIQHALDVNDGDEDDNNESDDDDF